jgi:hypothetical protein
MGTNSRSEDRREFWKSMPVLSIAAERRYRPDSGVEHRGCFARDCGTIFM